MTAALPGDGPRLRERAAKGVFWTAMSGWGNELLRLVVFVILSRLLTPTEFGLVALALVFIAITQVVADQGLADAVVQRADLEAEHLDAAFWISVGLGVVFAALLAGVSVPVAVLLGEEDLAPILAVLALAVPIASLSLVQRAILTRRMAFRSLAVRTLLSIGVGAALGIAAALNGFGAWSLVVQHLASPVVGMVVLWRVSAWRPRLRVSRRHVRDLLGFGVNVAGARLLTVVSRRSDELLIGGFLGAASLGFYTVAYRMLRLILQVTGNLVDRVAFPVYSQIQHESARFAHAYYKTTSFAALLAFPTFTGVLVMAPELVPVLFGPQWERSVPIMQILCVVGVMQLQSQLNSTVVKASGKPSWQLWIVALTAVVKLGALLIAVRYGLVAVAIAAAGVTTLMAPVWYWAVGRLVPVSVGAYVAKILGPLVASAVAAGVMLALRGALGDAPAGLTLMASFGAGALAYVAAVGLVARPLVDEALGLARSAIPRLAPRRRGLAVNAEQPGA